MRLRGWYPPAAASGRRRQLFLVWSSALCMNLKKINACGASLPAPVGVVLEQTSRNDPSRAMWYMERWRCRELCQCESRVPRAGGGLSSGWPALVCCSRLSTAAVRACPCSTDRSLPQCRSLPGVGCADSPPSFVGRWGGSTLVQLDVGPRKHSYS